MGKSCHFLCRKTRHVLKVQDLIRVLRCDRLPLKLVVGRYDLLSYLVHDVD